MLLLECLHLLSWESCTCNITIGMFAKIIFEFFFCNVTILLWLFCVMSNQLQQMCRPEEPREPSTAQPFETDVTERQEGPSVLISSKNRMFPVSTETFSVLLHRCCGFSNHQQVLVQLLTTKRDPRRSLYYSTPH